MNLNGVYAVVIWRPLVIICATPRPATINTSVAMMGLHPEAGDHQPVKGTEQQA